MMIITLSLKFARKSLQMEYNRTMDGFHSLANETHLGIKADGDMTFTIGETQTYQAKLILPRGIALAQTRVSRKHNKYFHS